LFDEQDRRHIRGDRRRNCRQPFAASPTPTALGGGRGRHPLKAAPGLAAGGRLRGSVGAGEAAAALHDEVVDKEGGGVHGEGANDGGAEAAGQELGTLCTPARLRARDL